MGNQRPVDSKIFRQKVVIPKIGGSFYLFSPQKPDNGRLSHSRIHIAALRCYISPLYPPVSRTPSGCQASGACICRPPSPPNPLAKREQPTQAATVTRQMEANSRSVRLYWLYEMLFAARGFKNDILIMYPISRNFAAFALFNNQSEQLVALIIKASNRLG